MTMEVPPDNRVVLVSGSAGVAGQAITREFLQNGWTVCAGWHRTPLASSDDRIFPVQFDVTEFEQCQSAVDQVLKRCGRIDVLVNNAGLTVDKPIWQMRDEDWDRVQDVNLAGAFHCAKAVMRAMFRRRAGHIVNMSSYSGRVGHAGQSNYAAAKAGLIGLTQALAREAAPRNVLVNAVLPGLMASKMTSTLSEEQAARLREANLLKRFNSPDEVARFIAFLVTMHDVSGQCFQLDSRVVAWS